jgi:hypothetical protein
MGTEKPKYSGEETEETSFDIGEQHIQTARSAEKNFMHKTHFSWNEQVEDLVSSNEGLDPIEAYVRTEIKGAKRSYELAKLDLEILIKAETDPVKIKKLKARQREVEQKIDYLYTNYDDLIQKYTTLKRSHIDIVGTREFVDNLRTQDNILFNGTALGHMTGLSFEVDGLDPRAQRVMDLLNDFDGKFSYKLQPALEIFRDFLAGKDIGAVPIARLTQGAERMARKIFETGPTSQLGTNGLLSENARQSFRDKKEEIDKLIKAVKDQL